ncbi:MAG: MFS transporter [Chloroflexota bacterium]
MLQAGRGMVARKATAVARSDETTVDEQAEQRYGFRLLGILLTATLFSVMNSSMVNVAIPSFMRDFNIDLSTSVWLYSGFVLPYAIAQPLMGVLGEHVGAKKVFLGGAGFFLCASLLCSLAWNFPSLLVFRALQALGSAAVMPNALVLVTAAFPARGRGLAMGIWSAVSGIGVGVGLTLAGFLVEYASWRAIFWVNVPFLLAVIVVGQRVIRELPRSARGRGFDLAGAFLLAAGLTALLLGLTLGQTSGWDHPTTLALFVGAVLGVASFLLWEQRARDALLPMALFRRRAYSAAVVTMFLQSAVFFGMFLLLPIYLQSLRGHTPLETGLMTLPLSLALMVTSPLAGRLSERIGPRLPTCAGLILIAVGAAGFSGLTLQSGYPILALWLLLSGVGIGLSISPLTSTAMSAARPEERGAASGFFNMLRFVGAVVGSTVQSVILANRTAAALPHVHAATAAGRHALAMARGFHDVYVVAVAIALVGAVSALGLQQARPERE